MKIAFLGAGFLASFIIPTILPDISTIILIDRETVSKENYENSLYPKGMIGKKKVLALSGIIGILASKRVIVYHRDIRDIDDLDRLYNKEKWDLSIVTFDNVTSRRIALDFAVKNRVPTIFVGVSHDYIYLDWDEKVQLPNSDNEIRDEVRMIRDICTRKEFRPLGALAAFLVSIALRMFIQHGKKISYIASIKEGEVHISNF